jgi:hypothetical protein
VTEAERQSACDGRTARLLDCGLGEVTGDESPQGGGRQEPKAKEKITPLNYNRILWTTVFSPATARRSAPPCRHAWSCQGYSKDL